MATREREASGVLAVFRHKEFARFWTAALLSNSAVQMQVLAVPIIVFEQTHSTVWVGLVSFCSLIPSFLLTPVSGVLADRLPRRVILVGTQGAAAANAVLYAVLWHLDALRPGVILGLQLLSGVYAGMQVAAWQSFVPTLVPPESLLDAVRLNSIQFTTARALGPAAAALALSTWGIGFAFVANAVTFAPIIAVLLVVDTGGRDTKRETAPLVAAIGDGARYVRRRRGLKVAILTGLVISFLGQVLTQFAAPIAELLYNRESDAAKSWLVTAFGVGAILGSGVVIITGDALRRSRLALFGLTTYALGIVTVGVAPNYALGLAGFGLVGLAHVSVAVAMNTSVQIQVDEEYRGRVMSLYLLGILGGLPAGALMLGLLGEVIDLSHAVMAYGLAMAVFLVVCVVRFDRLRPIDGEIERDETMTDEADRITP